MVTVFARTIFSQWPSTFSALFIRSIWIGSAMSHSKYEYVKQFEVFEKLLPNCWIVVRVDGKAFHRFSNEHGFLKPNDDRALKLMTACAGGVMNDFPDVLIAYGQSDEYSFVFRRDTGLYGRRSAKIMTNVVSCFASNYTFKWPKFFPDTSLKYPPSFDARTVAYPTNKNLRDYLSWRQVDCHINNLYNTTFWALVQRGGLTNKQAEERLRGTYSNDKNEILFSEFGINYNNEPEKFKKGTTLYRIKVEVPSGTEQGKSVDSSNETKVPSAGRFKNSDTKVLRTRVIETTCDIIGDRFWTENPAIIGQFENA